MSSTMMVDYFIKKHTENLVYINYLGAKFICEVHPKMKCTIMYSILGVTQNNSTKKKLPITNKHKRDGEVHLNPFPTLSFKCKYFIKTSQPPQPQASYIISFKINSGQRPEGSAERAPSLSSGAR